MSNVNFGNVNARSDIQDTDQLVGYRSTTAGGEARWSWATLKAAFESALSAIQSAASASATAAAASATNASNAATAASGSANTAGTSATNASNSATAAAGSATNAANSATSAGTSAGTATSQATAAAASATSAAASATTANTSATNAANSATSAATSATNAANSATAAGTSASNASNFATAAAASAAVAQSATGSQSQVITATHTFVAGNWVTKNSAGTWVLAKADSLETAHPVGRVTSVTSTTFTMVTGGTIDGTFTVGQYYLSAATAGADTTMQPSAGYLVPLMFAFSTTKATINIGDPASLDVVPVTALPADSDGTLAANSDAKIPTQKAVKTYVDGHVPTLSTDSSLGGASSSDTVIASQKALKIYIDAHDLVPNTATDLGGASSSDAGVPSQKAVKTYVDNKAPAISTDATLGNTSPLDTVISSQKALKSYIDTADAVLLAQIQGVSASALSLGSIMLWPRANAGSLPTGFIACDGTNGTPNLADLGTTGNFVMFLQRSNGTAPTLSSAAINTAGSTLTLTFNKATTAGAGGYSGVALTMSGGAVTATYASGGGTSALVYNLSRTVYTGETGTVAYTQGGTGLQSMTAVLVATFSGSSVTNSSTQTVPVNPTLTSATVPSAGTSISLLFSQAVSIGTGGNGGVALTLSGGAVTATYASGGGTNTLVYNLSRTISSTETGTLAYTQPGNGWEATSGGADVATIASKTITNNSTQTTPTFLITEDFGAAPSGWTTTGTINWNYTPALDGAASAAIPPTAYTVAPFTAQADVDGYFQVNLPNVSLANFVAYFRSSTGTIIGGMYVASGAAKIFYNNTSTFSTGSITIAANTKLHVWMSWKVSTQIFTLAISTDGTRPTTGSNFLSQSVTNANNAAQIVLEADDGTLVFDRLRVKATSGSIGSNP